MNANHILFKTDRFNLSKVSDHFINPCCFGEDLAMWLREKLAEKGVHTEEPYQEDWGWELPASLDADRYYLCVSGNADEPESGKDQGEWRIIVEKRRSFRQRLSRKGEITANDLMTSVLEQLLCREPQITDTRRESDADAQQKYSGSQQL